MRLERWYIVLAVVALVLGILLFVSVVESGIRRTQYAAEQIQASIERQRWLSQYHGLVTDAESSKRGYLLTGDERYLVPFERDEREIDQLLTLLRNSYARGSAAGIERADELRRLSGARFADMEATLRLYRSSGLEAASQHIGTDVGLEIRNRIREVVDAMLRQEAELSRRFDEAWLEERNQIHTFNILAGVVNVVLLLVSGLLVLRELRFREQRADQLEQVVRERTQELSDLSSHLQRVQERERARLARELHDELGGLLVAVKMDLAQLEKELPLDEPGRRQRWERIQAALTEGVALKRRVIEQLRPTLLDTMGLVTALRWQFQETCGRAGLKCSDTLPEDELELDPEAATAIFRIAQEAMTNIVKHADASTADVQLTQTDDSLVLTVRDNGRGLGASQHTRVPGTGHGLAAIRHRARSLGGSVTIGPWAGGGTEIRVTLPLERVLRKEEAVEA